MAGYDLEVDSPRFVALDVALHVCVKPDYLRSDVRPGGTRCAVQRLLPDGGRGLFHPDNFTFGAAGLSQPRSSPPPRRSKGVESVRVDASRASSIHAPRPLENGVIPIGRLEIARLDNNPNFPERGRLASRLEADDERPAAEPATARADRAWHRGCGCCAGVERDTPLRSTTGAASRRSRTASAMYPEFRVEPARRALVEGSAGARASCGRATTTTSRSGCSTRSRAPRTS